MPVLKTYLNGQWVDVGGDADLSSPQTFTNKTIDYDDNTLTGVQPTLVSGTNIKTINGSSVLGSGDLVVSGSSHDPVTVTDSTSIDLTISDQQLSAAAIFGTTSGTVSEGNHLHDDRYYTETEVDTKLAGKENFHGIEAAGLFSFDEPAHTVTIASITYWHKGTKFVSATPITCDLDDYVIVATGKTYFIYFDAPDGVLKASESPWNFREHVFLCTVLDNGSTFAIVKELHSHTRDLDWHANAHLTIGTRYQSGLAQTYPTTDVDNQLLITGGTIWDEDQQVNITQQTTARMWYPTTTGFTFDTTPSTLPYKRNSGTSRVQYYNTVTQSLTDLTTNQYTVVWVYAINDNNVPIYALVGQHATAYGTVAQAQAATPPDLSSMYAAAEAKLLYRWIYKGDGQYQEGVDYRQASTLPAGGASATSASSVTFTPYGNISASNVQVAIEELDTEKAAADHTHSSLYQPLDTQLTDLAGLSYSSNGGKVVAVKATADGFELVTASSGGGGTWGSITGDLEDQTDLQTALDAKLTQVDTPKIVTAASAPGTPTTGDIWVDTATAFNAGQSLLVAETVVSGSAVTSLAVSGLSLTTAGYRVVIVVGSASASSNILFSLNSDITDSKYKNEYNGVSNTGATTVSASNSSRILFPHVNSGGGMVVIDLVHSGAPIAFYKVQYFDGGTFPVYRSGVIYCAIYDTITSVGISSSSTNGLGIGTQIIITRRV